MSCGVVLGYNFITGTSPQGSPRQNALFIFRRLWRIFHPMTWCSQNCISELSDLQNKFFFLVIIRTRNMHHTRGLGQIEIFSPPQESFCKRKWRFSSTLYYGTLLFQLSFNAECFDEVPGILEILWQLYEILNCLLRPNVFTKYLEFWKSVKMYYFSPV